MPNAVSPKPTRTPSTRPLRVGFLALTDAAPLVAAKELGVFARHGLEVELCREIGWATIRDKIVYGELDAAQAPAPMLWALQLGLGCPPCEVLSALVLNLQGNALTLSQALWTAGVRDGVTLGERLRAARSRDRLTLGIVFPFSSHHLLLRAWLRSAAIDIEKSVRIVVVPPAQMFRNLAAGTIDGFYAGEPWNSVAVREQAGWCPTWSGAQEPGHVEKVLLVTRRFADSRPGDHGSLVAALAESCAWCDEPQNRGPLADLIAQPQYLNLPAESLTPALLGRFDRGHGRIEDVPGFHIFHRGDANVPSVAKATLIQRALGSAGLLSPAAAADSSLPAVLFREDLHRTLLKSNQALHA
jgi:two-component system, oxyanion-binding sensor